MRHRTKVVTVYKLQGRKRLWIQENFNSGRVIKQWEARRFELQRKAMSRSIYTDLLRCMDQLKRCLPRVLVVWHAVFHLSVSSQKTHFTSANLNSSSSASCYSRKKTSSMEVLTAVPQRASELITSLLGLPRPPDVGPPPPADPAT